MKRIFLYDFESSLDFGKYRNRLIKKILEEDPEYLLWAWDNISYFDCTERLKRAITEAVLMKENRPLANGLTDKKD